MVEHTMNSYLLRLSPWVSAACLLAGSIHATALEPDATDKNLAVQLANQRKKLILLVGGRADCGNCIDFDFNTLGNASVSNLIREAFVYWHCGLDQGCTVTSSYVSDQGGTFGLPAIFVLDPANMATYKARWFGFLSDSTFLGNLRNVLVRRELPAFPNLSTNAGRAVINNMNVNAATPLVTVPLTKIYYKLNGSPWTNSMVSGNTFTVALASLASYLIQGPASSNALSLYGKNGNGIGTLTNTLVFAYDPNATVVEPPAITVQPQPQTVTTGGTGTFAVTATGTSPTYKWYLNGASLNEGAHYVGTTTPQLMIVNAQAADVGDYTVVVANSSLSVTSQIAHLTISQPTSPITIVSPPMPQATVIGGTASFAITATNSTGIPMTYSWFSVINGVTNTIPGNQATLTLSSVGSGLAGSYFCVVSNQFDVKTTQAANLWIAADHRVPYFGLTVYGPVGQNCRLQYKTDLAEPTWHVLTNSEQRLIHSPQVIVDPESFTNKTERFYQVEFLP
jgi:hypothetical protein